MEVRLRAAADINNALGHWPATEVTAACDKDLERLAFDRQHGWAHGSFVSGFTSRAPQLPVTLCIRARGLGSTQWPTRAPLSP
jgi:hypothetical protein